MPGVSRTYMPVEDTQIVYDEFGSPIQAYGAPTSLPRRPVELSGLPSASTLEGSIGLSQYLGTAQDPHAAPPATTPITAQSLGAGVTRYGQQRGAYRGPEAQRRSRELMAMAVPHMGGARVGREMLAGTAGILGTTAQLVPAMMKTSAEKENERRLAALRRLESAGGLGLTQAQYARYSRQLMEPVRGMAREQRMATEARQASDPAAARSASALARGQREMHRSLREAGQAAGAKIVDADIQRISQQRQEIQERIAAAGREERRRLNAIGQYVGALGKPVGQMLASAPVKVVSKGAMAEMVEKYGAHDALLMANMMKDMGPGQRAQFLRQAQITVEGGE